MVIAAEVLCCINNFEVYVIMIYSLRGILIEKTTDSLVVECAGVGYLCRATDMTLSTIGKIGDDVFVYTYMNIYQDGIDLFGFADFHELKCFKMLISVSGVGPKAALAILSQSSPQQFLSAVASGDSKFLTKAKGVGKKMADRIILELKDKISKSSDGLIEKISDSSSIVANNAEVEDAIAALVMLGYSEDEIEPYLQKVDCSLDTSEIIRQVLKLIGKNK
jgi:Holliday junction DNA helicase RuvA